MKAFDINQDYTEEIEKLLQNLGYKLVAFHIAPGKKSVRITIVIYNKDGISHEDCTKVSKKLSPFFDEKFGENYGLEVSSPGINRVLKTQREYAIFTNAHVNAVIKDPQSKKTNVVKGYLVEKTNDYLSLEINKETKKIPINTIKKVRLDI